MILTGENRNTGRKTCHSDTLCNTNLTRTDPASNPGLRSVRPETNRLSHDLQPSALHITSAHIAVKSCMHIATVRQTTLDTLSGQNADRQTDHTRHIKWAEC